MSEANIRSAAKRREKTDAAKRETTEDLRRYCEGSDLLAKRP
jgi:hypothetical protein